MRIPDYQNVQVVKDINYRAARTSKVNKVHEDEFENELEDCINEKLPKSKSQNGTQKEHPGHTNKSQKLSEKQQTNNEYLSSWA